MWQRIQTVFLVIVITSLVIAIFFPIWKHTDSSGKVYELFALHYLTKEPGPNGQLSISEFYPYCITGILAIASVTLALIEIRKYKDRVLQMKLGALNSLFMTGAIGSAVYFATRLVKEFQGGQYGPGLWLLGVAVICNLLANRFIRRDERLVRDSDRLR